MKEIPNLPVVFAELLKDCREKYDFSQRKLSMHIGCARSYISFLEDGEHIPTIQTFMLLAEAFQMTPAEFQEELNKRLREYSAAPSKQPDK